MRKIITLFLILLLAPLAAVGCGPNHEEAEPETRTITDGIGRIVEIPVTVERIVPLANGPRMLTYLGIADRAVAISGFNKDQVNPVTAYAYASQEYWADLPVVGTDSGGATDYYPEEIIAVQPDVILCSYDGELADEIQTKTGIPVVSAPLGTLFEKDFEDTLRIFGDVCGVSHRAEEVISFINTCLVDLADRTADIPEDSKPTVMTAAVSFKGNHGIEGVGVNSAIFKAIAARDVTSGISKISGGVEVDREQIIAWDPEIIFLDTGGMELVRQDYAKNPEFYAQLQAFKDGRIYQCPSATAYYSNVEIPLASAYYDGTILYPEQFADINFEKKANEIFKFFLGLDNYLQILEEDGYGYQEVDFDVS